MPTDPNATQDPALDPDEDNPADEGQDTAPDTQGSSGDWEKRYKELQKLTSRVQRENQLLREQGPSEADDDEEAEEPEYEEPAPRRGSDRLAQDSWALAESVYGTEAIDAYVPAAKLWNKAQTPADFVAAFEAYHLARLKGAAPQQAAAASPEPRQPRVESNRPDESPDLASIDREAEAAKAKGDIRGLLAARLQRNGIR